MSTYKLVVPQSPHIRIEFKGGNQDGKRLPRQWVARLAVLEIVTAPCDSRHEAHEALLSAWQAVLRDPEQAIEALRGASEMGV